MHVEDIAARKANYVEIPEELSNNVISALKCIGVAKLYSHQVCTLFKSFCDHDSSILFCFFNQGSLE